jgi:hypothetical protein
MITIAISNFRGCERAMIECAPVALLGGLNGAGKSSIAQAVGAALSGATLPVAGLGRTAGGVLVRSGAATGVVEVASDDGSAVVEWPAAQLRTGGSPPQASEYAVGLQSIVTMAAKDRLRVMGEYLRADPTRDELAAALAEKGLGYEQVVEAIWTLIEQQGWDGAERVRRERGAEMKGQWRGVTGANYGSKIAATWRPDLAEIVESDLVAAVSRAQLDRDNAISAQAVSEAERTRLEGEADMLDERREAQRQATAHVEDCNKAFQKARTARQTLPPAEQQRTMPCPYCHEPIVLRQDLAETRLERASGARIDDAQLKERRLAIANADGALSHNDAALSKARQAEAAAKAAVAQALDAKERIDNWPRAVEAGTDLETAKQVLIRAEQRLAEWRAKKQADEIHAKIEGNEIAIQLLGSEGLRAAKLEKVVDVFVRAQLAPLCEAAGWRAVQVDAGGNIAYSGRPYALLSTSEQYRVRAILAVAMAQLDGSRMVVFDGADILDAPSRSGLFAVIDKAGLPALVTMTAARREQVPDLANADLGRSYWIAGGVVEPLMRVSEAA